jgi:ribose/xylose/arabinose/galactoside ABC-type transport system permease subunit
MIHWLVLGLTFFGLLVGVVGSSAMAAEYAGIKSDRIICLGLLIAGGLAGLAGACSRHRFNWSTTPYHFSQLQLYSHHRPIHRTIKPVRDDFI